MVIHGAKAINRILYCDKSPGQKADYDDYVALCGKETLYKGDSDATTKFASSVTQLRSVPLKTAFQENSTTSYLAVGLGTVGQIIFLEPERFTRLFSVVNE